MEEILEGIKELKTFVDKKQQWDVVNKIEGNKETISEPEKQDREKEIWKRTVCKSDSRGNKGKNRRGRHKGHCLRQKQALFQHI